MKNKITAILLVFMLLATISGCNSNENDKTSSLSAISSKEESVSSKEESTSSKEESTSSKEESTSSSKEENVTGLYLGGTQTSYSNGWIYYTAPLTCQQDDYSGAYIGITSQSMAETGLFRVRPDGSERRQVVKEFVENFLISGDYVYFTSISLFNNGQPKPNVYDICKQRLDGNEKQILCKDLDTLDIKSHKIYLVDNQVQFTTYDGLYRINAKGKKEKVVNNPGVDMLLVEDGKMYYNIMVDGYETCVSRGKLGRIYVKPVIGGKAICLSELLLTDDIYSQGDWIYFEGNIYTGTSYDSFLCKVKKDGSGFTKLVKVMENYNGCDTILFARVFF